MIKINLKHIRFDPIGKYHWHKKTFEKIIMPIGLNIKVRERPNYFRISKILRKRKKNGTKL